MPPRRASKPEPRPHVMTWKRAVPVLIVCGVFDATRAFFEMFWLFGPLVIGAGTAAFVSSTLGGGAVASAVGTVAGVAAGAGSVYVDGILEIFGVVMAMAIGLFGWLSVNGWLLTTNIRIYKTNATNKLWALVGLGISEIPIVGVLPGLTFSTFQLYRVQIKSDKAALRRWQAAEAARAKQEQAALQMQVAARRAQITQMQAQAANDNEATANEGGEIPEEREEAA